ncbi:MAG: bifunctional phosphopantothenoylcysteine decarboxylase/phosphopantothenate--cysteine ligase CoaBC [Legionellales bacterium]|nr:bifunctional phosphopantothenoylcysteine decarboxylase/phosphopantothenate--cysteine ligase CoaBC [Legionellales bacterium]|tara:strand:+ start:2384 stop:3598 length:1215 start_codon:yes stop_codon:yes gene_type:complete
MHRLNKKRILLGVTGGISAYKSTFLVRLLRKNGADVRVVMTKNACEFVTPLTFQALSSKPVHTELLDLDAESAMGHIKLAKWADLIIIAPASANFIARYANGFAADLLSTLCLATDSPVAIAPAMNQQMWLNDATQENIKKIKERGVAVIGPDSGEQACGDEGPGRMTEPEEITTFLAKIFQTDILTGSRLLVTAGPTREAIDPVRFLSNRSSGRMGYAIASAAVEAGADVTLVSGPVNIEAVGVEKIIYVTSAEEMCTSVMEKINTTDIFISVAAVADYYLQNFSKNKIKKINDSYQLMLHKTPDILAKVAALDNAPFTVGFAAETEDLKFNAIEKLRSKNLNMIAANQVGGTIGIDSEENALSVFWKSGEMKFPQNSKNKLARDLIKLIASRYNEKNSNKTH